MENREDMYYRTPFYMTYPIQSLYLTEMEYERDMERMKELYPSEVKEIQKMVEQRCNQMEYEGSRMYDENPDRMMLEEEAEQLLERFLQENPQYRTMTPPQRGAMPQMPRMEDEISAQQRGYHNPNWLRSLIGILFHDEMYRRRCRHRRCNRWW